MQYTARVRKEGRRTLVEFPDCPGCQTFAEASEDVLDVARDALEGWLETHLEDGEAPPRPARRRRTGARDLRVRIDPGLAIRLQIRWVRQDKKLSQADLAKRVGVTRQQITLLESQGGNLTVNTLMKVAQALGRDVDVTLVASSDSHAA